MRPVGRVSPEQLIERIGIEHRADFADFLAHFDNYYTTHSPENRQFAELIYRRLQEGGHIVQRMITQAYDPVRLTVMVANLAPHKRRCNGLLYGDQPC